MDIENRKFTRFLDASETTVDNKQRTISLAFSSEFPVQRDFGYEVLDHSPESIDLSRLKAGAPLLVDHDLTDQVGVVERVSIGSDRVGRVIVRFGSSTRANEVYNDVTDGIRRHVSVGYQIINASLDERTSRAGELDTYRVTKWMPYEISIVSVPADTSVGIGRNLETNNTGNKTMSDSIIQSTRDKEVNRIEEIRSIGNQFNVQDLANEAIAKGYNTEQLRQAILESRLDGGTVNTTGGFSNPYDRKSQASKREYSIVNVIRSLSGDRSVDIGYENELNQELQHQKGKRGNGFSIPMEQLAKRTMTAAGAGANLISDIYQPNLMIDFLRNNSCVLNNGAQTIQLNEGGNVVIPRQTGTATATWLNLDGTDSITASDQSFDQVELQMKTLTAMTTYTHKMLKQGLPNIEQLIIQDLSELFAAEIDRAALNGSGTSNQPKGILNQTGILTTVHGGTPGFTSVLDMEAELAEANINTNGAVYVTTPTYAMLMKGTEKATGSGQFIWTQGADNMGTVNGYKACYTKNMPASTILLAKFSDLMIGYWGSIDINVDPYGTNFAKGNISVRAMLDVDMNVRRPESFCVATTA
ncbi:phage major capsid protein [Paraglaciecola sp. 25GB23A]|uniref:phage major capsid protein n=1 Tax=Paraglaciecola sp. 25GB23A TaxID=3156068 RepID=UPI0032AF4254